jgi:hypothetical protein
MSRRIYGLVGLVQPKTQQRRRRRKRLGIDKAEAEKKENSRDNARQRKRLGIGEEYRLMRSDSCIDIKCH